MPINSEKMIKLFNELAETESENYLFYSLPSNVYKYLNGKLNVTFELFSTPFSCYFAQYCSAQFDIESYFGSSG